MNLIEISDPMIYIIVIPCERINKHVLALVSNDLPLHWNRLFGDHPARLFRKELSALSNGIYRSYHLQTRMGTLQPTARGHGGDLLVNDAPLRSAQLGDLWSVLFVSK